MKRQLRFFDILCLGINGIVGSGIFLFPGKLIGGLGPLSILQFALCGLLFIIIALCFAEAASRVDRNGGPYNYVRIAFGPRAGFAMGWLIVVSMLFNFATLMVGLVGYAGTLDAFKWLAEGWNAMMVKAVLLAGFAWLNIRGVRLGADAVNLLTIAKIVPLLLFVGFGIFAIQSEHFVPFAPYGFAPMSGFILMTAFAYQSFEVAPVPAGDVQNPARVMPKAMVGALLFSMALYVLIQTIVVGCGADVVHSDGPLADAAASFMGPWGAKMIAIGALVSMTGYLAGSVLLAPRSLEILCEDGHLPKVGAHYHPRHATPDVATIFVVVVVFVMSCVLNFESLVDIGSFVVVLQYAGTCLAVPILRKKLPDTKDSYRMPGNWRLPLLGAAISIYCASQIKVPELIWTISAIVVGFVVSFAYRHFNRYRLPVE